MNQKSVIVQEGSETVWIELGNITLNIYHISDDYMDDFFKLTNNNISRLDRKLGKIKCPRELLEVKVVLEMDSGRFYDAEWVCRRIKKCLPISFIRGHAKIYLAGTDSRYEVEQDEDNESERRIMNLFTELDQKKFIEGLLVDISNLSQKGFMEFYIKNSGWISFDDLLDLYYTFKIKK